VTQLTFYCKVIDWLIATSNKYMCRQPSIICYKKNNCKNIKIRESIMKGKLKQLGQGMTEYIIIVALIAVAAITVYGFFGDTVRGQVGAMTASLGGETTTVASKAAEDGAKAGDTEGGVSKTLKDFSDAPK
jgi:Flp pilus assembly pilin Flp